MNSVLPGTPCRPTPPRCVKEIMSRLMKSPQISSAFPGKKCYFQLEPQVWDLSCTETETGDQKGTVAAEIGTFSQEALGDSPCKAPSDLGSHSLP